jgi:hypothetical protein
MGLRFRRYLQILPALSSADWLVDLISLAALVVLIIGIMQLSFPGERWV